MLVCDISHLKPVASWSQLAGAVDGMIFKATQFTTFSDAAFAGNLAAWRRTGKPLGVYHFVGQNPAKAPPAPAVAEADWFLAHYAHRPGEMIVVDYEPSVEPADPDGWLAAFCQRVIDRTGVIPVIYMSSATAGKRPWARTRGLGCALWVARYYANTGVIAGPDPSPGAWPSFIGWQFTSMGRVPGIGSPVDLSRFDLTPDQWRAYGYQGDDLTAQFESDVRADLAHKQAQLDVIVAQLTGTAPGTLNSDLRGDLANKQKELDAIQAAVAGQDPTKLADTLVTAMGTDFAERVIDALGQRINTPPT